MFSKCKLIYYLVLIPDICWNGFFSGRFTHCWFHSCDFKKSSRDNKHLFAQMAKVCSTVVANSSKVPSSRQILIHAMNFASPKVFSVTYILECILLESVKLNKLGNKLWSNFPNGRDSLITQSWIHHHMITFLNHVNETNRACNGLNKKANFMFGRLGSAVHGCVLEISCVPFELVSLLLCGSLSLPNQMHEDQRGT